MHLFICLLRTGILFHIFFCLRKIFLEIAEKWENEEEKVSRQDGGTEAILFLFDMPIYAAALDVEKEKKIFINLYPIKCNSCSSW